MDDPSLSVIHDKYLTCLRTFTKKHFPNQPNRVEELLVRLPEVSLSIWNEYLWFYNVLFQNHLNHCFHYFFTGQESCLSFVGVQNVLRAILIKLVGWIIPHNVRDIPCSRSASAILRTSQIFYKLPPKVFVISSSYKLFKNAESEHCLFDRFFQTIQVYKVCWNIQSKDGKARYEYNKNYLQKGEITFLMWLLNEGHLISKFSLLPFGIISTKTTFKLSPSKFCQNRWRSTPSTCLTTKNKTHRFFWSKTKLSNYTPILYTASHFLFSWNVVIWYIYLHYHI